MSQVRKYFRVLSGSMGKDKLSFQWAYQGDAFRVSVICLFKEKICMNVRTTSKKTVLRNQQRPYVDGKSEPGCDYVSALREAK